MRKINFFALIMLIFSFSTTVDAAIIKYQDTVQTKLGQAVSGAYVEVVIHDTATPATLYTSDTGLTQKTSVTTDSNGTYWFYIEEGRYDLTISRTGMTTQSHTDVIIAGPILDIPHTWTAPNTFSGGLNSTGTTTMTDMIVDGAPYYDIRSRATLPAADAAAVAASKGLICASTYTISSAVTITASLRAEKGCSFVKSGSGTLTINGPFEAGPYQVFSGFSKSNITLTGPGRTHFEWFGHDSLSDVTVTVKTTDGDFTSVRAALDWLRKIEYERTNAIYIEVDDGIYTSTESIFMTTPLTQRVVIKGKNTYTKTLSSIQSSSGARPDWSIVLNLNSVSNIVVGDYAVITGLSGGTYPTFLAGAHAVTDVDVVNSRITIALRHYTQLSAPSGAVTGSVKILKAVMKFNGCAGIHVWNIGVLGGLTDVAIVGNGTGFGLDVQDNSRVFGYGTVAIVGFYSNLYLNYSSQVNTTGIFVSSGAMYVGILVTSNSALDNHEAISSGSYVDGFYALEGGYINAYNAISTGNGSSGFAAAYGGIIQALLSTATGNQLGYYSALTGYISLGGETDTNNFLSVASLYRPFLREEQTVYIANGKFITNTTGWTPANGTIAIVSDGRDGGNCLEITRVSGPSQYATYNLTGLVPGRNYTISFWLKSGTSGTENAYGYLGGNIQNGGTPSYPNSIASSSEWTRYQWSFNYVNTGTTPNMLYLVKGNTDTGTMLFDDVYVWETLQTGAINADGVKAKQFYLEQLNGHPVSATDKGTLGEIRITDTAIYVCTATNTWKKIDLTTW